MAVQLPIVSATGGVSLTSTDQLEVNALSAGSPGLTFVGDTDTGVFSPTANALSLAAGGNEMLRINDVAPVTIIRAKNTHGSFTLIAGVPVVFASTGVAGELGIFLGGGAYANAVVVGSNGSPTPDGYAGLVLDATISAGSTGNVQTSGKMTLSTAAWDAVTGQTGGLTTGSVYYATTSGSNNLERSVSFRPGAWRIPIGLALSTTEMFVLPPRVSPPDTNRAFMQTASFSTVPGFAVSPQAGNVLAAAKADAAGTAKVVGLAITTTGTSSNGDMQIAGQLELSSGEWDAVAGTSGGLSSGSQYFLSPTTAGHITSTCPTTAGQFVVPIGVARSNGILDVKIGQPIQR